jgi:hypothetical protein
MLYRVVRWSLGSRFMAFTVSTVINGFKHYKEIWYGLAMGVSMWTLDAAMHASLHGQFNWSGFTKEIIASDSALLLFRALFVIVSTALGISLWRSNRRKSQVQDLRASADSLYREIAGPLLLIVGYSQMLSLKEGWPVGREAVEIVGEIQINARKVSEVIKRIPPPGTPLEEMALDKPGEGRVLESVAGGYKLSSVRASALSNNQSARGM